MGKFRNGYLEFNTGVGINKILDEDNLISNDDEALATQQSIKAYIDNTTTSSTSPHGLDSTAHIGIIGTEDNFMSLDTSGLPQDSGYKASDFLGGVGQHTLDDTTAHIGITGTEDNFMSLDADGLPQDSTYDATDFENSGAVSSHESTFDHSDLHDENHGLDGTTHTGITGTEDNYMSLDANGLPQDSGDSASSFETSGAVTSHESTYDHSDLHDEIHTIDGTTHTGITGTEDNYMSLDANGLPQDSGDSASSFETSGAVTSHESTYDHSDLHDENHDLDGTTHNGVTGTEDNFMSLDSNGLPQDSGYKASDFSSGGGIHGIDSTTHIGITGTEDNFMSLDSNGLPQDSGFSDSSFETSGAVTSHESTYDHTDLHDENHDLDGTTHNGITGTEDNFMSLDSNGLPQDSGYDSSSFVLAGLEDTLVFSAGRNSTSTNTIYLRDANGIPTNQSPFIIPWNCTLIAMTLSTNGNETWTAELHSGLSLVSGASLSSTAQNSNYTNTLNIDFNAGDPIELYCNGSGINKPRVTVIFRRR